MKTMTPHNAPLHTLSLLELDNRINGLVMAFQGKPKTKLYEDQFTKLSEEIRKRI